MLPTVASGDRRWLFARLLANGLAQAVAAIATGFLIYLAFDRLIGGLGSAPFWLYLVTGIGLAASVIVHALLRRRERVDAEALGDGYESELRLLLSDRLQAVAVRTLQSRSRDRLMLRFKGELTPLRQWASLGFARLVVAGVSAGVALAVLTMVNPLLGFAATVVLALGAALILSQGPRLRTYARSACRQLHLAGDLNKNFASLAVAQLFSQRTRARERIPRPDARVLDAVADQAKNGAATRHIADVTALLAAGAVLLTGAQQVNVGATTPAMVVAAMAMVGLFLPALRDLGMVQVYWHSATVSRQKILDFVAAPTLVEDKPDAPDLVPGAGRLAFRDVSLEGALDHFSMTAEPGQVVAIVGPNSAGKSALLSLAARLIDPDQGQIELDGQNLAAHSLTSVRRCLGLVSPDLPLRGTIESNLRYRWPDAPMDEIARVSALTGVDRMVAGLPGGMDHLVQEGGGNLSLGQRNRLALARALVGNPGVLLLDETDSNHDAYANAIFDRVLESCRGTTLIITNRPDRLAQVSVVWRL